MGLGEKQELFSRMHSLLLQYITFCGYGARQKHLMRCQNCKVGLKHSTHKVSLAIDIVLTMNGVVTWEDEHYAKLHDFWDLLGGAKRIPHDLGHFSIEHNGVR